jgi:probable phosphoglycerate mutase
MSAAATLTLVRHGRTAANVERVWHGSIDTPLDELGREQARRLGAWLRAERADAAAVYASPLRRARDTAAAIGAALGRSVVLEPDLAEFTLGAWEGRSYRDLHRTERMWQRMAEDPDFAPPGGESPRAVATRVEGALRRIAAAHRGARAVVVSHGGALTLALGLLLDGRPNAWSRVADNASVSELVLEPAPRLLSFNETLHLGELAEEGGEAFGIKIRRELVG